MSQIIIDTTNVSREEVEELIEYLEKNCWDWKIKKDLEKPEVLRPVLKPLPPYVWYGNAYWKASERSLFGYGYYKLTSNLRFHPKGSFICQNQMRTYLKNRKAAVVRGEPVKNVQIVDDAPFNEE